MIKIKILSVGKTKEAWCDEGIAEYVKRLSKLVQFEFLWCKDEAALELALTKEKTVILLDSSGEMYSSEAFSHFLMKKIEEGGAKLAIGIGGPDGFTNECKKRYPLVSFSKMTFTHQMVRLILLEQIFRAFEIHKGSGYHK